MPLQLHFLEQIINVNWGGASVAIVGQEVISASGDGQLHRGESGAKGEDTKKQSWKRIALDNFFRRSLSYALVNGEPTPVGIEKKAIIEIGGTPTFVVGGGSGGDINARIDASHDGESWSTVYTQTRHGGGGSVSNIVWDPKARAFYAMAFMKLNPDGSERMAGYLLRSINGTSWTQVGEYIAGDSEEEYTAQLTALLDAFKAHCIKPENRGPISDGYQGYDYNRDVFIKPKGELELDANGVFIDPTIQVEIEGPGTDDFSTASFPFQVAGVWWAGGVWNVVTIDNEGGGPEEKPIAVFISTDDGKKWDRVYDAGDGWVTPGIVSAARSDIQRWKKGE